MHSINVDSCHIYTCVYTYVHVYIHIYVVCEKYKSEIISPLKTCGNAVKKMRVRTMTANKKQFMSFIKTTTMQSFILFLFLGK